MAEANPNVRYDLQTDYLGGVNSAYDPILIRMNQFAWGKNVAIRGGQPRTRPTFTVCSALPKGRIQGSEVYKTESSESIIDVIQGRAYQIYLENDTFQNADITPREEITSTQADFVQPIVGDTVNVQVLSTFPIQSGERIYIENTGVYIAVDAIDNNTSTLQNIGGSENVATGTTVTAGKKVYLERRLNPDAPNCTFCQAYDTMVIQDGTSRPLLFNGGRAVRSTGSQVPAGQFMAYGNGRLWVTRGRELLAGDIFDGTPESAISFTETDYLSEGGTFVMPEEITGLAFLPRIDNATEFGDLIVFTRNTTTAIRSQVTNRDLWKQTPGMQRLLFPRIGCVSHNSITPINQDLYFRSIDGIRSIRNTISDLQDFGNTPVSTEVSRIVDYDTDRWYQTICGAFFDNRLLMTANLSVLQTTSDYESDNSPFNTPPNTMVSLDFNPMSAMGQESPPAYDGEWTGISPIALVSGRFKYGDRCFGLCAEADGNFLVEITKNYGFDQNLLTNKRYRIPAYVEGRSMAFGNPYSEKRAYGGKLWFADVKGDVFWEISYRPDYYPCYTEWQSGTVSSQVEMCEIPDGQCTPPNLKDGYTAEHIKLKQPSEVPCNTAALKALRQGYTFQTRISWTGSATLKRSRMEALLVDPNDYGACESP